MTSESGHVFLAAIIVIISLFTHLVSAVRVISTFLYIDNCRAKIKRLHLFLKNLVLYICKESTKVQYICKLQELSHNYKRRFVNFLFRVKNNCG